MEKKIIGIDLGGTNLRIGLVTQDNRILHSKVVRSALIAEAKDPMQQFCKFIEEYQQDNNVGKIDAISIGVPSSVENDKETVIYTTNIRNKDNKVVFENYNIVSGIQDYFHVPACVNNDVNNILLYDIDKYGLAMQKSVVGIYIGTGVGGAVVIDGRPLEGKDGAELDIGHIPYYRGTDHCSCGKKGCCECYASGWRLQKIREKYYPNTKISEIFTFYSEDEPIKEFIDACSYVYATMATIFNPDSLIAGGGVIEMKDFPRKKFEQAVNEKVGTDVMKYGFKYIYSEGAEEKGVIGSAIFAKKRLFG